jgi:3-hydroxyisobutyrate dehydrogenase
MARSIARAGFDVRAWNRSAERAQPLAKDGARVASRPAEAADGAELMLTMLSDADAVLTVSSQAIGHLGPGAVWLQASTIGLDGTERCAELAREAGVAKMIERPFDDPAFRLALSRKDAELVLAAATESGIEVPIMEAVTARLRAAEEAGHGEEDMAATYWVSLPADAVATGQKGGLAHART